ncbi:uncharacterized protein [Ambystoma mexicanum]|uniref:uncharacterized protein isoform X2 n=1 Tax=Ambystoma mexicanum TaxID=8296 RepID=UPI0037E86DE9
MGLYLCRLWINATAPRNTSQHALQNPRAKTASERQPSSQKNSAGEFSLRSRTKMLRKQNAVDHHFMNGKKPKERKISRGQKKTQPFPRGYAEPITDDDEIHDCVMYEGPKDISIVCDYMHDGRKMLFVDASSTVDQETDGSDCDGLPACSIASNMKEQQELPLSLRKILKKPPQRFHSDGFDCDGLPAYSIASNMKEQQELPLSLRKILKKPPQRFLSDGFDGDGLPACSIASNMKEQQELPLILRKILKKSSQIFHSGNGKLQWSPKAKFAEMRTCRLVSKNLQKPLIVWQNRDNTPVVKAKDTQADEGPDRETQAALLFKCSAEKWAQLWYDGEKPVLEKLNSEEEYDEDKLFTCHKTDGYYAFRCEHFYVNVDPTRGELGLGGLASKSLFNLDMSIDIPPETFPQEN